MAGENDGVFTSAGTTISISASAPSTFTEAGYEAISGANWKAIGEVTDLGSFGREYALVTHNPLASRGTVKKKGSFNEGSIDMQLGLNTADAGVILAKTASLSDDDYSFKITTQNGDVYYFQAQVMSFKVNVGSVDQITSATIQLQLTTSTGGVGVVEVLNS